MKSAEKVLPALSYMSLTEFCLTKEWKKTFQLLFGRKNIGKTFNMNFKGSLITDQRFKSAFNLIRVK